MPSFQLPTEIWTIIMENINENETLKSLMLVNKQFYYLTVPFLYAKVEIETSNKLIAFFSALKEKPDHTKLIRAFNFNIGNNFRLKDDTEREFFSYMINEMEMLKTLILKNYISFFRIRNTDFKFNYHLVELEIDYSSFRDIYLQRNTFPNLIYLTMECAPVGHFNIYEFLHYFGFSYIAYKTFYTYLTSKIGDIYTSVKSFFAIQENLDFLLLTNDQLPISNFPKLRFMYFKKFLKEYHERYVYFFISAPLGLPSLNELIVTDRYYIEENQILDNIIAKRPPSFRFVREW